MIVYIALVVLLSALFVIVGKYSNLQKGALIVAFLAMGFIAAFRDYTIGLDTIPYMQYFDSVVVNPVAGSGVNWLNLFDVMGFESGYMLLNYVVSLISDNFTVFLVISHLLILGLFARYILKNSKDIYFSAIIYFSFFFLVSMNHLRQAIAMAIITLGFNAIVKRQLVKYLLIVGLATLFHQSAIIMIIPYFVYTRKFSRNGVFLASLTGLLLTVLIGPILNLLASMNPRYEIYLSKISEIQPGTLIITVFLAALTLYVVYLRASTLKKPLKKEVRTRIDFFTNMMLLSVVLSVVSISFSGFDRMVTYFMIFAIIGFPYILSKSGVKSKASIKLVLSIIFILYAFSLLILKPEWLGIVPYKVIFG